ncbi:hypothetical protein GR7B_00205 [Vibrio phage vB_VcorM_GR7B]|nr:hypothetical protein GR7B_00205 [Vibrio phage vB_VcorM_GR7B]
MKKVKHLGLQALVSQEQEWIDTRTKGVMYIFAGKATCTPLIYIPVLVTGKKDKAQRSVRRGIEVPEDKSMASNVVAPVLRIFFDSSNGTVEYSAFTVTMSGSMLVRAMSLSSSFISEGVYWDLLEEIDGEQTGGIAVGINEPSDKGMTAFRIVEHEQWSPQGYGKLPRRPREALPLGVVKSKFLEDKIAEYDWASSKPAPYDTIDQFRKRVLDPTSSINFDIEELEACEGTMIDMKKKLVEFGFFTAIELIGLPEDWTEEHW